MDALLLGTKYLNWGSALSGIALSVVLFFANLSLGLASAMVFVATFLLCVGVTLLLLPKARCQNRRPKHKSEDIKLEFRLHW